MVDDREAIQFQAFKSAPDISFWKLLSQLKLESFKLNDKAINIESHFTILNHKDVPARACLDKTSFKGIEESVISGSLYQDWRMNGTLYNTNTLENYRNLDKTKILEESGRVIWENVTSGKALKDPKLLNSFVLCTFADLKKHTFIYWFGFPAVLPEKPFCLNAQPVALKEYLSPDQQQTFIHSLIQLTENNNIPHAFLILDSMQVLQLSKWSELDQSQRDSALFGFVDPCPLKLNPGWPLRNFLMLIAHHCKRKNVKIICFREQLRKMVHSTTISCDESVLMDIAIQDVGSAPKFTGWEPNARGKMGPRQVDLRAFMDPMCLADASADLNLKLMKWRQLPSLNTDLLGSTRCLLLGSGTLGCNIARCLLGWGVRNITFLDNSTVSYSNPARQSLFEFSDCQNGGKPKAQAAADALRRILPSVQSSGVTLSIPMPGHPLESEKAYNEAKHQFDTLNNLIDSHDAVFLGTDSRESRWLPTIMCASKDKVVLNAALGFDTYLVMRHGAGPTEMELNRLGCYFCNDVVAPENSLRDRTLDQMCTVTRPGLAPIAAALAVELMIGILHHPLGHHAPYDSIADETTSKLGILPHQIRGFLAQFKNIAPRGQAYDRCTACSSVVVEYFNAHQFNMLVEVCNSPAFLETLTGLDVLRQEAENVDFDAFDSDEEESLLN